MFNPALPPTAQVASVGRIHPARAAGDGARSPQPALLPLASVANSDARPSPAAYTGAGLVEPGRVASLCAQWELRLNGSVRVPIPSPTVLSPQPHLAPTLPSPVKFARHEAPRSGTTAGVLSPVAKMVVRNRAATPPPDAGARAQHSALTPRRSELHPQRLQAQRPPHAAGTPYPALRSELHPKGILAQTDPAHLDAAHDVAAQLHAVYNGSLEATAVSAVPVMDGSGYDSDEWADADYTPEEQQFFDARFEREDRQIAEWNAGSGGHVMEGSGYDSDEWGDADYTPEEQQFFDARFEREDRQIAEWNARHDAGPATEAATDATGAGRGPDQINRATVTRPVLASRLRTHTLSVLKTRPVEIVGAAPPSRGAGAIGALIASAAKLFSLPVMVDHAVAKTQATRMTLPDAPANRGSDA